MVRAQELACRRGLHEDDWEPLVTQNATPDQAVDDQQATPTGGENGVQLAPAATAPEEQAYVVPEPVLAEGARAQHTGPRGGNGRSPALPARHNGVQGPARDLLVGASAGQPARRELNTDGIPIVRQRSVVVEAQRNAQRRREHERRRLAQRLAEQDVPVAVAHGTADQPATPPHQPQAAATTPGQPPADAKQAAVPVQPASQPPERSELRSRNAPAGGERGDRNRPQVASPPRAAASVTPVRSQEERSEASSAPARQSAAGERLPADEAQITEAIRQEQARVMPPPPPPTSELAAEWEADWRELRRSELPGQCCRTCRDYRASETPGRGWCGSPFAHSHRQIVTEDDLACLGPLGTWWVPSDQCWLEKAATLPSQPTPLADGLVHLLQWESSRRRPRA